ncbi:hypothetical protein predicted by Glimmer/Critica [Sorangium cellulosum So ce56]|uniref:Uncharacterized protein n=1 Tax=Sorangium cellulosum (strain So ce56) TaxID=448385 RepID=A9G970_SORC5|nr:hypothetical protein predicted by Glimmer/Critica [Sorangium cellulosum So ce56]
MQEWARAGRASWGWKLSGLSSNAAEELFNEGYVCMDGPDGFRAAVHKRLIEFTHLARWWSFLHERDVRQGLRESLRLLSTVVRASMVIYLPDSGFRPSEASDLLFEDAGAGDVKKWLETNVGPSMADVASFLDVDDDSVETAYFIEEVNPGR